jgi:molybdenum cofactor cytidylyltransferase
MGLGPHELVAIVGAGGKTTILHALGRELAATGRKVILTTTTRMAPDQIADPVCWSDDPREVDAALSVGAPLFVLSDHDDGKVVGLGPDAVDHLFSSTSVDHLIAEADGARTMSIKAPAAHEPVIPRTATTVIVVMGADAFGRPLGAVAHRADRITALTGFTEDDLVTPGRAAAILLHTEGGLKGIPPAARVVVAITKVTPDNAQAVSALAGIVSSHASIDRCVEILHPPG